MATTISERASTVQKIERLVCTTTLSQSGSKSYGTPTQWWIVRSSTAFSQKNATAETIVMPDLPAMNLGGASSLRRIACHHDTIANPAKMWPRSIAFRNGRYGNGSLAPASSKLMCSDQRPMATRIATAAPLRYATACSPTGHDSSELRLEIHRISAAGTTMRAARLHAVPLAVYVVGQPLELLRADHRQHDHADRVHPGRPPLGQHVLLAAKRREVDDEREGPRDPSHVVERTRAGR